MTDPHEDRAHALELWGQLKEFIVEALEAQDSHVALAGADALDAGKFRIIAEFDPDTDGDLDPLTLSYKVEVLVSDGWAGLCRVHWTRLELDVDDMAREVANVRAQREMGIVPSPDDPL